MADVKWIKITTDIFDDDKILLIESCPDADACIVIWFKLLCLAGKQNNSGVFLLNDRIAYTDEMLATIFRRPLNTVRMALRLFEEYGMIERVEGIITIPNWDKHQSLDALEKKREYQKQLMRKKRAEQKLICEANSRANCDTNCDANVSPLDKNREDKKREDKNIKKNNTKKFASAEAVYYPNDEKLNQTFQSFILMRQEKGKPITEQGVKMLIKKLDDLSGSDSDTAIKMLETSIEHSWESVYELKGGNQSKEQKSYMNADGSIDWSKV